jgi:Ras-related C3 botulinum toxin substrate 1
LKKEKTDEWREKLHTVKLEIEAGIEFFSSFCDCVGRKKKTPQARKRVSRGCCPRVFFFLFGWGLARLQREKRETQRRGNEDRKIATTTMETVIRIKCVLVGDSGVGKTLLLFSYMNGELPKEHIPPTVSDNYVVNLTVGQQNIELSLWDTSGNAEYDRLRPLNYPNTDIFLICFSIVKPVLFENITVKWYPEIQRYCPEAQIILVGTEVDLRDDPKTIEELKEKGQSPITYEEGLALSKVLKARNYVECSVRTRGGVDNAFNAGIYAAFFSEPLRHLLETLREIFADEELANGIVCLFLTLLLFCC